MSAHAAPAPTGPTFTIRGRPYPVLLPKLADPRLHLAAVIISLQVIGQIGFHFELSIAQILLAIGTCAVLEVAIAMRQQHVILWPASATLTGNGVAFVLRVPGTVHGDWWSLRGWWIYVGTAAVSLLSKHVIRWRGEHIFNPSNIGLVLCFLLLGRTRAAPLDFWWGPMSAWLVIALAIIVAGGFLILRRLKLLRVAIGFWVTFAVAIGAARARGAHDDGALAPRPDLRLPAVVGAHHLARGARLPLLHDHRPEDGAALADCPARLRGLARPARGSADRADDHRVRGEGRAARLARARLPRAAGAAQRSRLPLDRRFVVGIASAAVVVAVGGDRRRQRARGRHRLAARYRPGSLPPITILPAQGVQTKLDLHTAQLIAHDLVAAKPAADAGPLRIWLVQGVEQGPPTATVQEAGLTYHLHQTADGHWALPSAVQLGPGRDHAAPKSSALRGVRLTNVAPAVGLDFRQDSFRYGVSNDNTAMMGGGVCWLDYNGDGWQDLFAVNSYASSDTRAVRGARRTAAHAAVRERPRPLPQRHREHSRGAPGAGRRLRRRRSERRRPARPDRDDDERDQAALERRQRHLHRRRARRRDDRVRLVHGRRRRRRERRRPAGRLRRRLRAPVRLGAELARRLPDEPRRRPRPPLPERGERPERPARFREVGVQAGLEASDFSHGLGATFLDVNGDGRPDLYVANDEDPNQLYVNVPWPGGAKADPAGLGFRFENRAATGGSGRPVRGHGSRRRRRWARPARPLRHQLAPRAVGRVRSDEHVLVRERPPRLRPGARRRTSPAGATRSSTLRTPANPTSCSRPAASRSRACKDAGPVKVIAPLSESRRAAYGVAPNVLPSGLRRERPRARGCRRRQRRPHGDRGQLDRRQAPAAEDDRPDRPLARREALALQPRGGRDGHARRRPDALAGGSRGSSYLSSEDQRVHFGLGSDDERRAPDRSLPVGRRALLRDVRADRIVDVAVPRAPRCAGALAVVVSARALHADDAADARSRRSGTRRPSLRSSPAPRASRFRRATSSTSPLRSGTPGRRARANRTSARNAAISYAAYRVLLWEASFNSNLQPDVRRC